MEKFYLLNQEEVFKEVDSSMEGLTSQEAQRRLEINGKNKLEETKKESLFRKFINSISDPMIIMLMAAAGIQAVVNLLQMSDGFKISEFADVIDIKPKDEEDTIPPDILEKNVEGNTRTGSPMILYT